MAAPQKTPFRPSVEVLEDRLALSPLLRFLTGNGTPPPPRFGPPVAPWAFQFPSTGLAGTGELGTGLFGAGLPGTGVLGTGLTGAGLQIPGVPGTGTAGT